MDASYKHRTVANGLPLPPSHLRRGNANRQQDADYIASAIRQARLVQAECEVSASSTVLDIGCGPGRLLRGLLEQFGSIARYVGVDVHQPSICWLRQNLAPLVPNAEFIWSNYLNNRYNPHGSLVDVKIDGAFDAVVLWSVFSHMRFRDVEYYLDVIRSALAPGGSAMLTAFVEDDVETETENPKNYLRQWSHPLHCVLFNKREFERRIADHGLAIKRFTYRHRNTQSIYTVVRSDL